MAAGMGSRYGGLKQIDPVGPNGEIIIDYSMYDAIAAGFGKIVFVIRHSFEEAFHKKIAAKIAQNVETAYAYQELDACLGGFACPAEREKPWGTGQAILVAKDVVAEPFAVINADDYYGPNSFKIIAEFLKSSAPDDSYAMAGYVLANTLSKHGEVARGICQVNNEMLLEHVTECTNVKMSNDSFSGIDRNNAAVEFRGNEIVSMNLWAFQPSVFGHLQNQFDDFLAAKGQDERSEFFIPDVVDRLIVENTAKVKVLVTGDEWFGVTYREDRDKAAANINRLIDKGVYPEKLWS